MSLKETLAEIERLSPHSSNNYAKMLEYLRNEEWKTFVKQINKLGIGT